MKSIGIDVHKSYSQIAVLDTGTGEIEDFRIGSTPEEFEKNKWRLNGNSRIALEASSHWAWVVDELERMGLDVVLSHPTKTKAIGLAKVKTDKIDARMLARLLASDMLPEAHISKPEVRELRSYLRYRYGLVKITTQVKNKVHGILLLHGMKSPYRNTFCIKGRQWLEALELRLLYREQIRNYLRILDVVAEQIAQVNERIESMATASPEAMLLTSIKGIGYYSALLLAAEIDGVGRFGTAKRIVNYFGLCPSTRSSGGHEYHGHITRTGSPYVRWILIEAAQKATYPTSPFYSYYINILRKKGKSTAKVAVARKMLECIYQILKTGREFDATALTGATGIASKRH